MNEPATPGADDAKNPGLSAKALLRFPCPKCGEETQAPRIAAGTRRKCERCGKRILVPKPGEEGQPQAAKSLADLNERQLDHERHLRALSIVYRFQAVALVAGAVFVFINQASDVYRRIGGEVVGGVMIAGALVSFVVGHGLWRYANWARVLGIAFNGLALLGSCAVVANSKFLTVVGLVAALLPLWALIGHPANRMGTPQYHELVASSQAKVRWGTSFLLWFLIPITILGVVGLAAP